MDSRTLNPIKRLDRVDDTGADVLDSETGIALDGEDDTSQEMKPDVPPDGDYGWVCVYSRLVHEQYNSMLAPEIQECLSNYLFAH